MGWDPIKRTIDAPEEWWAEKLQPVPSAKKFKFVGIDPVMEEKLDGLFTGVVATGTHAFTPNDIGLNNSAQEMDTDNELEIFREVRANDVPMWATVIAFLHHDRHIDTGDNSTGARGGDKDRTTANSSDMF
ncbi:uncharacterized protein LOC110023911 [Phalaenopsis equestris]|uniref:uncharacterized protein LOC110023911 n=1 Tax=Phalaenopsis equestris TaxID=78828 RepID=UPI0009E51434|nr:uncharacterized protein LOC110023911 [Phalaenopsis equestris]